MAAHCCLLLASAASMFRTRRFPNRKYSQGCLAQRRRTEKQSFLGYKHVHSTNIRHSIRLLHQRNRRTCQSKSLVSSWSTFQSPRSVFNTILASSISIIFSTDTSPIPDGYGWVQKQYWNSCSCLTRHASLFCMSKRSFVLYAGSDSRHTIHP